MSLKIAFSPCPNDTYMVYGLLHQNPVTIQFDQIIADVEELNEAALAQTYDVTKLSFRTFFDVSDDYDLLSSGAALGHGNGPLLISKRVLSPTDLNGAKIAVPGLQTTATFLLQYAFQGHLELVPMLFSEIEAAIIDGEVDAGVIIHETRFLYKQRGLICLKDLGAAWEEGTGLPIPLGGFAVRKSLPEKLKHQLAVDLRSSIGYARQHEDEVRTYVKSYAQELDDEVITKHIDMFVNEFSMTLGAVGERAIACLFNELNRLNKKSQTFEII